MNEFTPAVIAQGHDVMQVAIAREAQEVQAAVIVAKKFPRDRRAAFDRIMQDCERVGMAEQAMYAYPKGGQTVTGPSIRLAETIGQNWGNLSYGVRELSRENGSSVCEAYCWDLETNVRRNAIYTVNHIRDLSEGKMKHLTSERDIYELIANYGSRRVRNCILGLIPGDVVEAAIVKCETTLGASGETKDLARKMLDAFAEMRVTRAQIEKRLAKLIEAITRTELVQLRKIYQSMKDGASEAGDWFEQVADPAKITRLQNAPSSAPATPRETQAKDADLELARNDFRAAMNRVLDDAGDPGVILGEVTEDILAMATVLDLQNRTDILMDWVAKLPKPAAPASTGASSPRPQEDPQVRNRFIEASLRGRRVPAQDWHALKTALGAQHTDGLKAIVDEYQKDPALFLARAGGSL